MDEARAAAISALGEERFIAALDRGHRMSTQEALAAEPA